jgi:hypothetical protein
MKKKLALLTIATITSTAIFTGCSFGKTTNSDDSLFADINTGSDSEEEPLFGDDDSSLVGDSGEGTTDDAFSTEVGLDGGSDVSDSSNEPIEDDTLNIDNELINNSDSGEVSESKSLYSIGEKCKFKLEDKEDGKILDCNFKVKEVKRGVDAESVVKEFNSKSEDTSIESIKNSDLEFAVVSYEIELGSDSNIINPISTEVSCRLLSDENKDSIVVGSKKYSGGKTLYVTTDNTTVVSGVSGTGRIIFTVPKSCKSFHLKFGNDNDSYVIYEVK